MYLRVTIHINNDYNTSFCLWKAFLKNIQINL